YELGAAKVRRKLMLVHGENTLFIAWEHQGGAPVRLQLRPYVSFRFHDHPIKPEVTWPLVQLRGERVELHPIDDLPLRFRLYSACAAPFVSLTDQSAELLYRVERARGLDHTERQASPGYFE